MGHPHERIRRETETSNGRRSTTAAGDATSSTQSASKEEAEEARKVSGLACHASAASPLVRGCVKYIIAIGFSHVAHFPSSHIRSFSLSRRSKESKGAAAFAAGA